MPQTYLPFGRFSTCALVLDDRRLSNQRVDNIRVLQSLCGHRLVHSSKSLDSMTGKIITESWAKGYWYIEKHLSGTYGVNKLWRGYESLFRQYHNAICSEWKRRGYSDTCYEKFETLWNHCYEGVDDSLPDWFGDTWFHMWQQALLIEKAPDIYRPKFPGVLEGVKYAWPKK